jgi:hypothetical protein
MPLKGIKQNKLGLNWKAADLAPVKRPEDLKSVAGAIAGGYHAAGPSKRGMMRRIASGQFRKMGSDTCAKTRQRRYSPRSESGLSWA